MCRSGGSEWAARRGRWLRVLALAALAVAAGAAPARAQLGALISPGRLSKAHADLEGISKCSACHERGQRVTAEKCLSCHKPVADRIARKVGVHAAVGDDCVTCHVEHAGVDGELRPFDQRTFDHARVTGFPLDGRHARLPGDCAACHTTRSFLDVSPACASCHADPHKGSLGAACASCHGTKTSFKALGGSFDHSKAAFALKGAHQTVACASCHVNQRFKGLAFSTCDSCHRNPHPQALTTGAACTSCHTEATWRTQKVDHTRTSFPLKGLHANVRCEACHKRPAPRAALKADTCASCHADPHRGSFKQDCAACHRETGFKDAPFDHTSTSFALTGAHSTLACAACHKPPAAPARTRAAAPVRAAVTFSGLDSACGSCHADVHEGELTTRCQACHSTDTFHLGRYTHLRAPAEFFTGQHAALACDQCHVPPTPTKPVRTGIALVAVAKFTTARTACATCHRDVHLGQVGSQCESCHALDAPKFAATGFSHTQTHFALSGRHAAIECVACHKVETGAFPAGPGTAMRLAGVPQDCSGCHADVHLGQLGGNCETCHGTGTFHLSEYRHRSPSRDFFTGSHLRASCQSCHKAATRQFPGGGGTAVAFSVTRDCVACHEDTHRGSLGPRCEDCHRP